MAEATAELREQIARWLYHNTGAREDRLPGLADDLLAALPAVADALAAAEAVKRVEALADGWRAGLHILDEIDRFEVVHALDAALSGD